MRCYVLQIRACVQLVWSTVVEEQASVLEWADLVNQRYLLVCYLEDVKSVLKVSHVSGCCTLCARLLHTPRARLLHTTCQDVTHHVSGEEMVLMVCSGNNRCCTWRAEPSSGKCLFPSAPSRPAHVNTITLVS